MIKSQCRIEPARAPRAHAHVERSRIGQKEARLIPQDGCHRADIHHIDEFLRVERDAYGQTILMPV
jgi:hypothetical protein